MSQLPPVSAPMPAFPFTQRSLILSSAACWLLAGLVFVLMTQGALAGLDRAGLLIWRGVSPPAEFTLESVRDITALGGVVLRNLIAVLSALLLASLARRKQALWLVLTVAAGWGLNSLAKLLVYRPRPDFLPHWTEAVGPSFPSGHSFNGAVVCLALGLIFAGMARQVAVRRLCLWSAVAISLAIAWSRVWLGVHYPTDVVAGWLGGAGWVFLSAALANKWLTTPALQ